MKQMINNVLLTGAVALIAPQAIADAQIRIGGNGVNNPAVDMMAFDNIVKLRFGSKQCTGTMIAGKWLLTTAHCAHHDGITQTEFSTAWKPSGDNSYYSDTYYANPTQMVVHPGHDDGSDSGAETALMEVESYPNYAKFNPINIEKMKEIAWEDFCMRTGLNEYFTNEQCEWARNPETGYSEPTVVTGDFGQELFMYGYAGTRTLRRGRIEVVNDFGSPREFTRATFMGAYADGYKPFDADGINSEGGDSGSPYIDKEGRLRGVHYGKSSASELGTTHADKLAYKPDWILNTINSWHYPTQVTTENDKAVIYFQSLHSGNVDLLNTLSTDGVEIIDGTLSCKTPQNDDANLIVEPWDICQMTIKNTSQGEGKVYLSSDSVITVDYGRDYVAPELPEIPVEEESSGGSMGWSLSALGLLLMIRRQNLSTPKVR